MCGCGGRGPATVEVVVPQRATLHPCRHVATWGLVGKVAVGVLPRKHELTFNLSLHTAREFCGLIETHASSHPPTHNNRNPTILHPRTRECGKNDTDRTEHIASHNIRTVIMIDGHSDAKQHRA